MKLKSTLLAYLLFANTINAQTLEWAKSFGGLSADLGASITVDASGNVYTTGYFNGTIDLDPGAETANHTSMGGDDIFVQKLDTYGNLIWSKSYGGIGWDRGNSITMDASGNVYITGYYRNIVDFNPGAGTAIITALGPNSDAFVLKLDASGNFIWVKTLGGISGNSTGESITVDASGHLFTIGYFSVSADFDSGIGTANLTSTGDNDVFVQKMDVSGNFIWAKSFGGSAWDQGNSIAVDDSGNVYTTGYFRNTVDFDPGPGTVNFTAEGNTDFFIHKLDAFGNYVWAKSFGGNGLDEGNEITVDASGNVYTTGYYRNTVDFNPGEGIANLTSIGSSDCFIQKLDASGNFIWAKSFGGNQLDQGNSIALDDSGNVYTTGYYRNTVDFNPGAGTANFTSTTGDFEGFVQKLDASGNFIWAKSFGGSETDFGLSITVDASGNVYATGVFESTANFDPGAGTANLTSTGGDDFFVLKLNQCIPFTRTDVHTACDSYTWIDGNTYTSSNNTATWTLTNTAGCDSVITLNLTINHSNTGTDVQTACDSYTWIDGNTYTSSNNTATWILPNATGCDSVITLNLTINNSYSETDIQTACESYTWIDGNTYTSSNNTATWTLPNAAGCDSVITLNLTINHSNTGTDVQTACDSYTWIDGNTYTSSNNTATWTLTNTAGCDSVITLNLTINHSNTGTDVQTACDSYTWIDGNTYTSSNNTATWILPNATGCDSVITLNLTINNSYSGTDVQTACESYTWIDGNTYTSSNNTATWMLTNPAGCDSVITLHLTINNSNTVTDIQTACDSYTWIDGNTYTSSNTTAIWTLTNTAGCDSVVTLNLSINSISDITTSLDGSTITATNSNATYQWLDCDNNYTEIVGETGQTFTATTNGNYAVELTENGCVATSSCVAITTIGIIENTFGEVIKVFPNPAVRVFTIDLGSVYESTQLTIRDGIGRIVYASNHTSTSSIQLNLDEPTGIYLVEIASDDKKAWVKLILE